MTTPDPWARIAQLEDALRRSVDDFTAVFGHDALDTTCYRVTLPHFALSGDDLPLTYDRDRHMYHVVQQSEAGSWEAYGPSTTTALLALIAKRAGYDATFEWAP